MSALAIVTLSGFVGVGFAIAMPAHATNITITSNAFIARERSSFVPCHHERQDVIANIYLVHGAASLRINGLDQERQKISATEAVVCDFGPPRAATIRSGFSQYYATAVATTGVALADKS